MSVALDMYVRHMFDILNPLAKRQVWHTLIDSIFGPTTYAAKYFQFQITIIVFVLPEVECNIPGS